MKRSLIILFFTIIVFSLCTFVSAADGEPTVAKSYGEIGDGVTAELFSDGELVIRLSDGASDSSSGRMNDFKKSTAPFSQDKDLITSVSISSGVTYIGNYALYGLNSLSSFTVDKSVTEIGTGIFTNCKITDFHYTGTVKEWCSLSFTAKNSNPIASSENFYIDGKNAKNLVITDDVTEIAKYAFYRYEALESLTVSNSVRVIYDEAFCGCDALRELSIPADVTLGVNSISYSELTEKVTLTVPEGGSVLSSTLLRTYQLLSPTLSHCGFSIPLNGDIIDALLASCETEEDSPRVTVSISDESNAATRVTKISFNILNKDGVSVFNFEGGVPVVFKLSSPNYDSFEYSGLHTDIVYDSDERAVTVNAKEAGELTATATLRETPRFSGAYISLSDRISLIYRVEAPSGCELTDFTAVFCGSEYTLSPVFVSDGVYDYHFREIMPYQMGDTVSARVTAEYGDGETVTVTKDGMSIRRYCELAFKYYSGDAKLITLLSDMLTYGAAAQSYRNYKTDELVTNGFSGLTPSEYTSADSVFSIVGGTDETKFVGASLYLTDTAGLYLTFKCDTDAKVRITLSGRSAEFPITELSSSGVYGVLYTDVMAYELDCIVTAELINRDTGDVISTLNYSVVSYVCENEGNSDAKLVGLLKALQCYGFSAKDYRGGN